MVISGKVCDTFITQKWSKKDDHGYLIIDVFLDPSSREKLSDNLLHRVFILIVNFKKAEKIFNDLAFVMNYYKLPITCEFYKVGERLGKSGSIIRDNYKFFKDFNVSHEGKIYNLDSFVNQIVLNLDVTTLKGYVDSQKESKKINEDSRLNYDERKQNFYQPETWLNESNYNDNLDMDQQDPDFWDS